MSCLASTFPRPGQATPNSSDLHCPALHCAYAITQVDTSDALAPTFDIAALRRQLTACCRVAQSAARLIAAYTSVQADTGLLPSLRGLLDRHAFKALNPPSSAPCPSPPPAASDRLCWWPRVALVWTSQEGISASRDCRPSLLQPWAPQNPPSARLLCTRQLGHLSHLPAAKFSRLTLVWGWGWSCLSRQRQHGINTPVHSHSSSGLLCTASSWSTHQARPARY